MATGITGRLVRRTTKEPLQGITIEAVNASTGVSASTTTTTDTEGFFEISGLTSAVYFAKPLVSGDDWDLLPNIAEIYTDEIHINGSGSLAIDRTATSGASVDATTTVSAVPSGGITNFLSSIIYSFNGGGSGSFSSVDSLLSFLQTSSLQATAYASTLLIATGKTLTDFVNFAASSGEVDGTLTNYYGLAIPGDDLTNTIAGTNRIGIQIKVASGSGNYAIYSPGTAQSEFAGSIKSSSDTGGVGYATGAGGTVTQLTSKSTSVTNNNICGKIVTHNAALAAGASVVFLVNNTTVDATDVVLVNIHDSGAGMTDNVYRIEVAQMGTDYFNLRLTNLHSLSLSEPVSINFAVIKAVAA